jgi:FkbM family methyltransferase
MILERLSRKIKFELNNLRKGKEILRFTPVELNFLDHKLYVHDIASYHLGLNEVFQDEIYKFTTSNKEPLIIDCGANLGMSIIYFKKLYPDAKIIAFEADKNIFNFLEKNVRSFGLKNVELINKAVWNANEDLIFMEEGGAGGRIENGNNNSDLKMTRVQGIKLNQFLREKVDFLKIDIEGAEFEVLEDCKEELKNVENLFIEYHSFESKTQKLHTILEIIQNAGFRYYIKEAYNCKHPFFKRDLNFGMDLQLNIFCYRTSSLQ